MIAMLVIGCAPYPEGLRRTPDGDGPVVRVDWEAEPLADIPSPNDLATRADPTSPTGLRVNVPVDAHTDWENEVREKLDELTGWGIYSAISVGFDAPIDLEEVELRHRLDSRLGAESLEDDAIYVIDVTPESPTYLDFADLDLGEGRFPQDVPNPSRYFPNDSRGASPSLLFDTVEEDLDGDGELDWGEDTDGDGRLDHPNVFPLGGDPREDLLTFYERASDTLIARPVVPLREETTYAVVLTNRLIGEDGNPVRSPWTYVHHLRQGQALEPVLAALPAVGLGIEDVAFAWTFTTARVTGDLVDIRRGLVDGVGPFAALASASDLPARVEEAAAMHEIAGLDPVVLPADTLVATLTDLDLFSGESADVLLENYSAFASGIVGGAFTVPYLLADRDDGGYWDADEWWKVDPVRGTVAYAPQRLVFSCVIPRETESAKAPFPTAFWGHGYGSSRYDALIAGWAFARMGWALCAMDFPGHGAAVDEEQEALLLPTLESRGLLPFWDHLQDARHRDLDNDHREDSGGDQWTADAFHTRDMVRQASVDWMQAIRAFKACGSGTMTLPGGGSVLACDWDGDGTADLGGADNRYAIVGGSLGGINSAVAAGVMPEVESFAPVVAGGGLVDVATRTEIGGAVEAMAGRLMTPMMLGYPDGAGGLRVVQLVNSERSMKELPVAALPSVPGGGRVVLENLDKGITREVYIPADGSFRVGIAADGLDPFEKRLQSGMPPEGPDYISIYEVEDNAGLGDRLRVTLYDADGNEVAVLDTWQTDVKHEGVTMRAGSPLVAGSYGSGYIRGSVEARRVIQAFGMVLEPGDPIAYAPHYVDEPFEALGGAPANVLLMPTPGDTIVSVNAEIALARAAGYLPRDEADPRYGVSVDQYLIDTQVVRGLEEFGPYVCNDGAPCLYDADDADGGTDEYGAPSGEPLRATMFHERGAGGMRIPYADPHGSHAFGLPEPSRAFDINNYAIFQLAGYLASGGTEITDDPCLEDSSCAFIPALP